jgi:bifunctional non-homologous end joining protein LigD
MPLEDYRRKRDFAKTPEPPPGEVDGGTQPPLGSRRRFVIQRHRATRLHYDFRLEIDGVLVSWAVPKGPSLDADVRRMAVHVEDHPVEYFDFEGVIPAKQYGAGDVIVWDWGRWSADPSVTDAARALHDGELKVHLEGEKLHGGFVFIRTDRMRRGKDKWLLIHRRDDEAIAGWDAEDFPDSVKTGRTNDDLARRRRAPGG